METVSWPELPSRTVAHTQPQTRKGRCPVAEELFGMYIICIHHILFKLCLLKKERKKMNKIEIFAFGFLELVKGSWNLCSRFSIRIGKGSNLQT